MLSPFPTRDIHSGLTRLGPCWHGWCVGCVLVLIFSSTGCVRRRLTVRSDPPGALVYVDDQEIGITPVSTSFIHYGTRKIQLVQDGHETVTQLHTIKRPWYQYPIIDFFSENVYPREIRDEREIQFQMTPQRLTNIPRLVERAEDMRSNLRQGIVAPLPDGTLPGSTPPPAESRDVLPIDRPTSRSETERLPAIR
ncbi:MAG: PEGA domain-containing protein [Planctomycetota bacterium]|nr:PEGA domain-containing protein [Planctomycetota bacterium]MDA1177643.1 PEGA domain-containing protein [Planctomycetota bacterium]